MKQTRKDDKDRVGCLERGTLATLRWKLSAIVMSQSSTVTSQQTVSEAAVTRVNTAHVDCPLTFPKLQ